VKSTPLKADRFWKKSRITARILLKTERGRLNSRDLRLAGQLIEEVGVTNRLIDQAMSFLKARKNGYRLLDKHN